MGKEHALEQAIQYFWRVRASNEAGTGEWSDTWTFTTQSGGICNLCIQRITSSQSTASPGMVIQLTASVINNGTAISPECFVDLYYDRASEPTPLDEGDDYFLVPALQAGESADITYTVTGPSFPAEWTMWVYIDRLGEISESEEADNIMSHKQLWRMTRPLAYLHAHGDLGMIVFEYQLGGTGTLIEGQYPVISLACGGQNISDEHIAAKQSPECEDSQSYAFCWNSMATIDTDGTYECEVTIETSAVCTYTGKTIVTMHNSQSSVINRRALWLTDAAYYSPDKLTIRTLLENAEARDRFFQFCNIPSTQEGVDTLGHPVRFAILYFTMWYYNPDGGYEYVLDNDHLARGLTAFAQEAHKNGIRIFAGIDQNIMWLSAPDSQYARVLKSIRDFATAVNPPLLDGVVVNIELSDNDGNDLNTPENHELLRTWLASLKYGSESQEAEYSLAGVGLELRMASQAAWQTESDSYLSTLMPWADSVLCNSYSPIRDIAFNGMKDELRAGRDHGVCISLGMETQNPAHCESARDISYYVSGEEGGYRALENNTERIYGSVSEQGLEAAFSGYAIFFYQAYLDLSKIDSGSASQPNRKKKEKKRFFVCSAQASRCGHDTWILPAIAIVCVLFLAIASYVYRRVCSR